MISEYQTLHKKTSLGVNQGNYRRIWCEQKRHLLRHKNTDHRYLSPTSHSAPLTPPYLRFRMPSDWHTKRMLSDISFCFLPRLQNILHEECYFSHRLVVRIRRKFDAMGLPPHKIPRLHYPFCEKWLRRDSNPWPSEPESDALFS